MEEWIYYIIAEQICKPKDKIIIHKETPDNKIELAHPLREIEMIIDNLKIKI